MSPYGLCALPDTRSAARHAADFIAVRIRTSQAQGRLRPAVR